MLRNRDKYNAGLGVLKATAQVVDKLKADIEEMKPNLAKQSKEVELAAAQVAKDQAEAKIVEDRVSKDAEVVNVQAAEVARIKAEADAELGIAMPALNKALKAVSALEKGDITTVKSQANPPELVKSTMDGCCILFGEKPDWGNSKKLLGKMTFLEEVQNQDKDNIKPAQKKALLKHLADNPDITVDKVTGVSSAAGALAGWLHAMIMQSEVKLKVAPLEEKVAAKSDAELTQAAEEKVRPKIVMEVTLTPLEAARNAIDNLDKADIGELKGFSSPKDQ